MFALYFNVFSHCGSVVVALERGFDEKGEQFLRRFAGLSVLRRRIERGQIGLFRLRQGTDSGVLAKQKAFHWHC